jgi:hypothetical protein
MNPFFRHSLQIGVHHFALFFGVLLFLGFHVQIAPLAPGIV